MRLRTLMLAVVIVAFAIGLLQHIRGVIGEQDDLAPAILILEVIVLGVCLVPALAIGFVYLVVRKDRAYAASLGQRVPIEWRDPTHAKESQQNHW